jgi:anhydro-N-acetylmuramic acid kinase
MSGALDWLHRFSTRPSLRVIGLLSGTSADGVDAALVAIRGAGPATRAELLGFVTRPFSPELRGRVHQGELTTGAELCTLNFLLGEELAAAALSVCARAGLRPTDVDLIGSHGQTMAHQPRSQGHAGATLQIGEAAVIAERLGVPVVCDFRVRDVAAGGEGAPLLPLAEYYLFREPGQVRAVQNLGGIASVTIVPDALDEVFAFDNGPGNMILDAAAHAASHGALAYDQGGEIARRGRVDPALLSELLAHPFLALPPPRSTGREAFGAAYLAPLLQRMAGRTDDLQATLTRFVAEAIFRSYVELVFPRARPSEVLVSGGGVHNDVLMQHLGELFRPLPVSSTTRVHVDPDAKEAIAFAILANETCHGLAGNLPRATGASGARVLGKIVPP